MNTKKALKVVKNIANPAPLPNIFLYGRSNIFLNTPIKFPTVSVKGAAD